MSFTFLNQLPTPEEIKRDYPLTPELAELKKQRDAMGQTYSSVTSAEGRE